MNTNPENQPCATFQVTLDRPRELRLTFRALKRYATASGKDIFRDAGPALTTIEDFRALVWAMARETDPSVKLSQLSAHIGTAVVLEVSKAIKTLAAGGPAAGQCDISKN